MSIQLGLGAAAEGGRALYHAIARELGALSFTDRMALLAATTSAELKPFAELEPDTRALFTRCAEHVGQAYARAKGLK